MQALLNTSQIWLLNLIKIRQNLKFCSPFHSTCPRATSGEQLYGTVEREYISIIVESPIGHYWARDLFSTMPSFFSSLLVIYHLELKTLQYSILFLFCLNQLYGGKDTSFYFVFYNCTSFYLSYTLPFFQLQLLLVILNLISKI